MLFVSTLANGNYLFNACSIALNGNECLSSYLRCLTSRYIIVWQFKVLYQPSPY